MSQGDAGMTARDKQTQDKQSLRKQQFARRKLAHGAQASAASVAVIEPVLALIDDWLLEQQQRAQTAGQPVPQSLIISGYWPIRTELDPRALIAQLQYEGHRLCLPIVPGPDVRLVFRDFASEAALVEGAFGAKTPPDTAERVEPQVVLVPLLAFDALGYRLGYGGGYYDRTLEDLRAKQPTLAIGLAYDEQEVAHVVIEPTDQRLDAMVTPSRQFRW